MNARQEISAVLTAFLGDVAGGYGELVTKSIPEMKFKQILDAVSKSRAIARDNLVQITREAVIEAVEAVQPDEIQPVDMVASLVPPDNIEALGMPAQAPVDGLIPVNEAANYVDRAPAGSVPDLAPAQYLPGHTGDGAENAGMPSGAPPPAPGGGMFDVDDDDGSYHQPPKMTLAEESRIAAGLPQKLKRPVVHTGRGAPGEKIEGDLPAPPLLRAAQASPVEPLKVEDPNAALLNALAAIEGLLVPHIESKNAELATVVCAVLTHLSTARSAAASMTAPSSDEDDVEEDAANV